MNKKHFMKMEVETISQWVGYMIDYYANKFILINSDRHAETILTIADAESHFDEGVVQFTERAKNEIKEYRTFLANASLQESTKTNAETVNWVS